MANPARPVAKFGMAWRIHESVVRGEIDNRENGVVRGKIWIAGLTGPVELLLKGNAHPDLAGCLLKFFNPGPAVVEERMRSFNRLQRGTVGDLTASRKVRVFEIPLQEALAMIRRGEKPPEHMANSVYLEWFSEANGRVVIESVNYELTLSAPLWRPTPEDEAERSEQAAAGMADFMKKLTEAVDEHKRGQKDPEEEWDEFDYEKFLKESDARTDKYLELLEKYGTSKEAEAIINKEMGWDKKDESDGPEWTTKEEIDAMAETAANAPESEPAPEREGIDWIRTQDGDLRHPLQHRCFESAIKFSKQAEELGLEDSSDADLETFLFEFQTTSVKLAGALSGIARGEGFHDPAFNVAYLKRALNHLHLAQTGLAGISCKKLLPDKLIAEATKELFEIREGILALMDKFRGRI